MGWDGLFRKERPLEVVLRLGRFETTGDGAGIAHLALPVVQLISTLQFKKLQRLNDVFFWTSQSFSVEMKVSWLLKTPCFFFPKCWEWICI